MISIKIFNATQDFVDFIKAECEKLAKILNLEKRKIIIYVFKSVDDLCAFSAEYCEFFRDGQSTIISRSYNKHIVLIVQENWEARGRNLWKGMLAESLCFTLLEDTFMRKLRNKVDFLMSKIERFAKLHEILANLKLYEYCKPILEDMVKWRIENIRDFKHAMILRNETGAMMFLSYIYPAIIAIPYAKNGFNDAQSKILILISHMPKILKPDVAKIINTSLNIESIIIKLSDFVNRAYFVAL